MYRTATLVLGATLAGGLPAALHAQTARAHVGPHVSYHFDAEAIGIGAQLSVPIVPRVELYPSFSYFFVDPGSLWALNADLKLRVSRSRNLDWLYFGAGLGIHRAGNGDADTELGVNLLAGAESLRGRIHPFGEARVTVADESWLVLAAGLNVTLPWR